MTKTKRSFLYLICGLLLTAVFVCSSLAITLGTFTPTEGKQSTTTTTSVWDGSFDTSWYKYSEQEFTLTTAAQLKGFAVLVERGISFAQRTVKLGADMDMKNITWDAIQDFDGTFDGQNHTISNVTIGNTYLSYSGGWGFFGTAAVGMEIANTVFENCTSHVGATVENVAIILGYSNQTSTIIRNCKVINSSVEGKNSIGAIVGNAVTSLQIVDSVVDGCTIHSNSTAYYPAAGGLCGKISGSSFPSLIKNCQVLNTDITVDSKATNPRMSIFYRQDSSSALSTIENCYTNMYPNDNGVDLVNNQSANCTFKGVPIGATAITFDGVDVTDSFSLVDGKVYGLSSAQPTTVKYQFYPTAVLSEVAVSVNGVPVECTVENNAFTLRLDTGYNVVAISVKIDGKTVVTESITGFDFMPEHTLMIGETKISEHSDLIKYEDDIYYLKGVQVASFTFTQPKEGVTVSATVGGVEYEASDGVVNLGTLPTGEQKIAFTVTYEGCSLAEYYTVVTGLTQIADGNVYWISSGASPWIVDENITDSVVYKSTNTGTGTQGIILLYAFNVHEVSFKYATSGGPYDYSSINRVTYQPKVLITQYADLNWQSKTITYSDAKLHIINITHQISYATAEADHWYATWIKEITSSFDSTVKATATFVVNYDEKLGTVYNYYGHTKQVLESGKVYTFDKGTKIEIVPVCKSGIASSLAEGWYTSAVFGYQYSGTSSYLYPLAIYAGTALPTIPMSYVYSYTVTTDCTIDCSFLEPIPVPEQTKVSVSVNGETSEQWIDNGGEIILDYNDKNQIIALMPVLGAGEKCYIYIDGVKQANPLPIESDYYFYTLTDLKGSLDISMHYEYEGYEDGVFDYFIKIDFSYDDIKDLLVQEGSADIVITNDATYPYAFDSAVSATDRMAVSSGNKGKNNTSSVIALTVKGSGSLAFDYYISSQSESLYADYVCVSINEALQLDSLRKPINGTTYLTGELASSCGIQGWQHHTITIGDSTTDSQTETTVYIGYVKNGSDYDDATNRDIFSIANLYYWQGTAEIGFDVSDESGASDFEVGYITVSKDGGAATDIKATTSEVLSSGMVITLNAVPNEGYQFYYWKNSADKIVGENKTLTFPVTTTDTYTAVIARVGTYIAKHDATYYSTLDNALAAADTAEEKMVYLVSDLVLSSNIAIPDGVTLILPYAGGVYSATEIGTAQTGSSRVSWTNEAKYLYRTLTINEGVVVTVKGALVVGGIQHYPDQSPQGHTSGAYAQIVNNGNIVVDGILTVHGLIKGTGTVTANSGATLSQPFMVNNYTGGSNTLALYQSNQFPFEQFATVNIQCKQVVNYGARVVGLASLYFWSSVTTQSVVLVDTIEHKSNSVGSLIWMHSGSRLEIAYDGSKAVDIRIGSSTYLGDSGLSVVAVYGQITAGEFSLQGYGSNDMVLAIPYTYNFILESGAIVNIPTDRAYKLMPGAIIEIKADATLNVFGTLYVFDGFYEGLKNDKYYPRPSNLAENGFSKNGVLYVDGTLNIEGTFAGIAQAKGATGQIVIGAQAKVGAQNLKLGSEGEYHDNRTEFTLQTRVYGENGFIELAAGKTYKAVSDAVYKINSFTCDYWLGATGSSTRNTFVDSEYNQSINGRFLEYENGKYIVTATFSIGAEFSGIDVNLQGVDYRTDELGQFVAKVELGQDLAISYYTKGVEVEKSHTFTFAFDVSITTLSEVVASVALDDTNNKYTHITDKDGNEAQDFVLNAVVTYFGGASEKVALKFVDQPTKYTFSARLTNDNYTATFTAQLSRITKEMSAYVAKAAELKDKTSDKIVAFAEELYADYQNLIGAVGINDTEINFVNDFVSAVQGYASQIVCAATIADAVTYGDTSASATVTFIDGTTSEGQTVSYVEYTLSDGVTSAKFEYSGSFEGVEYQVETTVTNVKQRAITVTIANKTSVYGDSFVELTADITVGSLFGDDQQSSLYTLSKAAGSNVGTYAITGVATNGFYAVSFEDGTYTITARPIEFAVGYIPNTMLSATQTLMFSVTQSNNGKAIGITFEIRQNNELIATVASNGTVTMVDGKVFAVGDYDIVPINNDDNYNLISATAGTLTLVEDNDYYEVTFTFGAESGVIYDGKPISVSVTAAIAESKEAVDYANLTKSLSSTLVDEIRDAGTYTVSVTVDGLSYSTTFVVAQRTVDIVWGTSNFVYDGTEQRLGFTLNNVCEGDVVSGVYGTFACTNAGKHTAVIASLSGADAANYTLPSAELCAKEYTIATRKLVVQITDKESIYGEDIVSLTFALIENTSLAATDTDATKIFTLSKAVGNTVGNYDITGTKVSENYDIQFKDGNYKITQRKISVLIDSKTSIYGENLLDLTSSLGIGSTLATGDVASGVWSIAKEVGTDADEYDIVGTVLNDNYDITFSKATYTISPRAITLKVEDATAVYGDNDTALTATLKDADMLVSGDEIADIISLSRATGNNVGTYNITATDLKNTNYTLTLEYTQAGGYSVYTITQRKVTLSFDSPTVDNTLTWATLQDKLTYQVTDGNVIEGDTLGLQIIVTMQSQTVLTEANFAATFTGGVHKISGTTSNGNYDVTIVDGTLTVTKPLIRVQGIATQFVYTGNAFAVFDWKTNISGYLDSATANSFSVAYSKLVSEGVWESVSEIKDAGEYKLNVSIVHTYAYDFAADAVTEYFITVSKADISGAIEIFGPSEGGVYSLLTGWTALSGAYDVALEMVLSDGVGEVTITENLSAPGEYTYTVTVVDNNYCGEKSVSFRIVPSVANKMTALSTKVSAYADLTDGRLAALGAIRSDILALTEDDYILIADSPEYTALVEGCETLWAEYLSDAGEDFAVAEAAANCHVPAAIVTLLSVLMAAFVALKKIVI